jgi:hypothetical protein
MTDEAGNTLPNAAETMLDAFLSVGANHFVLTWRTLDDEFHDVRKHWSAGYIRRNVRHLLAEAERQQLNLIIRPTSPKGFFLQLDDISPQVLQRAMRVALFTVATSPVKAQAWLFVEGKGDEDADLNFRRRVKKACATDPRASESVRVAGSLNFKQKYAPNFPCVAITYAAPGLMASRDQLQELGLVAAPDIIPAPRGLPLRGSRGRSWPDYQRCLAGARLNSDGTGPDRSGADYMCPNGPFSGAGPWRRLPLS